MILNVLGSPCGYNYRTAHRPDMFCQSIVCAVSSPLYAQLHCMSELKLGPLLCILAISCVRVPYQVLITNWPYEGQCRRENAPPTRSHLVKSPSAPASALLLYRWGRGQYTTYQGVPRLLGEATETLRDIYHTEFGLAGLINVAEMAWQQNKDLYSYNGYAIAAAMELHAKIINAGKDPSLLPAGFAFFESMPAAPAGCTWTWDGNQQLWVAKNPATNVECSKLQNGVKYILGSKYLSTNWEIGFNHYVGRLGMWMPETALLLSRNWPDWFEFHWGLTTLTHADAARHIWRRGVKNSIICTR